MLTKIINHKAIIILLLMVYLSACSNAREEKNDMLLKGINESLLSASGNADGQCEQFMKAFLVKMQDPAAYEFTQPWYSKAELIKKYSTVAYEYIESLKQDLSKQSSVYESVLEKNKGEELYNVLKQCRKNLLAVDSAINEEFKLFKVVTTRSFDSLPEKEKDFTKYFFKNVSVQQAMVMLTKFQCDIRTIEYQMLSFCYKQTGEIVSYKCDFSPKIIAYHTSKYVKPNEMMDVNIHLDEEFFGGRKPEITFNGKPVKLDYEWFGVSSIKASGKKGEHHVPILISYKDYKTGRMEYVTKNFVYYVDSIPTKP